MKFVVVTYGTEGDVRPFAALCRALMDAGHDVLLLGDAATLGSANALGVPTIALAGDIKGAFGPNDSISGATQKAAKFNATEKALARIANANAESWLQQIVASAQGCDAIIASGLAAFVGLSAAEYLGVKVIGASMIPITPTAAFPSPLLPPKLVPKCLNRASHHFVNGIIWRTFRKHLNAARASICDLPARKKLWTDHAMLYGVSPSLLPPPADWPANAQVCGQWIHPSPTWSPPQALNDFLAAGVPPIYVGFGSMVGFDRARLLSAIAESVAGRRALFYPGWSDVDTAALPANFHIIGETPHDWLFPRTSVVIHHGGSGTTHSAARAGVPSIVVPFVGDQLFWAERLKRCGVAAEPANGKHLRAEVIAQGIEFSLRADVRERARALGEKMRAEDGLADAINALECLCRLPQR